ncbi:ArsR/SmtB family transcription factor [Paenibacillus caseinilyticus]|uniref:ArsR family transcriptional regulator n=1 Tax=Paenibacillus mucilaginosus K02 TaxID=997761 RepID=I0BAI8_9BACL|nr:winged helix-turn-helix domain-containing protein [Paenibacillus mucilaginosus]AFH59385.1 ArsR family transcriptional regulator [Paenibacillus mucilaginosus K02]
MSTPIDIKFAPTYELINSLHTYLCRIWHKRIDLGADWHAGVRDRLSPGFRSHLDASELRPEWRFVYLLAHLYPGRGGPASFLDWLEELSPGDMYELLAPRLPAVTGDLAGLQQWLAGLLRPWYEQYFADFDQDMLVRLEQAAGRHRALLGTLPPAELAEELTNGLRFEEDGGVRQLVLTPQYHFQPGNVFYLYGGGLLLCQYPADLHAPQPDDGPSPPLYRTLRSLGERSRLRILRYVSGGPRSFTDILRHVGLSKGITHEHISNLRCAGLLRAHVVGENVTVFSLRSSAVIRLQEQLLSYVEGDADNSHDV